MHQALLADWAIRANALSLCALVECAGISWRHKAERAEQKYQVKHSRQRKPTESSVLLLYPLSLFLFFTPPSVFPFHWLWLQLSPEYPTGAPAIPLDTTSRARAAWSRHLKHVLKWVMPVKARLEMSGPVNLNNFLLATALGSSPPFAKEASLSPACPQLSPSQTTCKSKRNCRRCG